MFLPVGQLNLNLSKVSWSYLRKANVIAIPKPGKASQKSYRPISLLCIPYKLYERLMLMRISRLVDEKLTKDQEGFRPGRSCAGQLINLTQHIKDGSVLVLFLFNIYTNDQPLPTDCSRFMYADDLCITTQQSDFQHVEQTLETLDTCKVG